MNKVLKLTRDGFTLVELMIVVAIIGILATIAVPQYQKFVAKSKQTEAKIGLGAVYTAESSFQTENNSYSGCLGNIGYSRDGTKFYFTIGFGAGIATSAAGCAPDGSKGCAYYNWIPTTTAAGVTTYANNATSVCTDAINSTFFQASVADGNAAVPKQPALAVASTTTAINYTSFTIGAVGSVNAKSIGTQNATGYDYWTINNLKNLANTKSGI